MIKFRQMIQELEQEVGCVERIYDYEEGAEGASFVIEVGGRVRKITFPKDIHKNKQLSMEV